jgi:glycosyltransferase involved in cell wall biosynthesis
MKRVLHVVPAYLPATDWGGPVFSTSAICRAAVDHGYDVYVLTTDSANPSSGERLVDKSGTDVISSNYRICYARKSFGNSGSLEMILRLPFRVWHADLVHISMTYSFPTLPTLLLCFVLRRPVIWSPRGAVQARIDWDLAPRKRMKKVFELLIRKLLPADSIIHVTASTEKMATSRSFKDARFEVVPNSVDVPGLRSRGWRPNHKLRLLFLSRLHEKKGLELLLHALVNLESHIELVVAGSGAPSYEQHIKGLTKDLDIANRVRFVGSISGDTKIKAFSSTDLFVLPSFSENFGIVVAEALANGLPVITTTRTPWVEVEEHRCGSIIEPVQSSLESAIRKIDQMTVAELEEMGLRGRQWILSEFSPKTVDSKMMALYEQMLS